MKLPIYYVFIISLTEMSKNVQAGLQSTCYAWPQFKNALEICRQPGAIHQLENLRKAMLTEWFEDRPECSKAVIYLETFIWGKRQQWATVYFRQAFTMGHATTQRVESWNGTPKIFKHFPNPKELAKNDIFTPMVRCYRKEVRQR